MDPVQGRRIATDTWRRPGSACASARCRRRRSYRRPSSRSNCVLRSTPLHSSSTLTGRPSDDVLLVRAGVGQSVAGRLAARLGERGPVIGFDALHFVARGFQVQLDFRRPQFALRAVEVGLAKCRSRGARLPRKRGPCSWRWPLVRSFLPSLVVCIRTVVVATGSPDAFRSPVLLSRVMVTPLIVVSACHNCASPE